ncbi:MAG: UDP-3-O-(3-hydroxymyristoyl)glucosamine N-acyltransferase [Bacteroidales bacterium]|nr:MAG: UDP-3-O-(3-hydroxymyristoyl)glucosamine N-acyltransferase [Bacteroidales bacterium]
MEFTAQAIAQLLGGTVEGNPDVKVNTVAKIEDGQPGALSFLANPKYAHYIYNTQSSIVLVNNDFVAESPVKATLVRVSNAYEAFASLLQMYVQSKKQKAGIEAQSFIHSSAKVGDNLYLGAFAYISENAVIGSNVKIYPNAYIGDNVKIGDSCIIYPSATIYEDCVLGNSCVIHAGAVIGADGFGFASGEDTNYKKVPQIGNVIIEDHVEIGANATIDRATMGSTILRKGVKLDDHVHIAHNVEVGENTVMAAQSGVAGSTKIGKNCMFGGQVGISPHLRIADGVKAGAQAGIPSDIKKEGSIVLGSPASDISAQKRSMAVYKNLPELRSRLSDLEKIVEELSRKISDK